MRFFLTFIFCCSLIIGCNSVDPGFPYEETLTPELLSHSGMTDSVKVEINPPFLILRKMLSQTDNLFHSYDDTYDKLENTYNDAVFVNDSLYVVDAQHTAFGSDSYMIEYYADPDMKRVYVNDQHIVFCYGYKKQIDFMDFNYNLINRVKFKFANPKQVDPENQGDLNLSYICSYFGKHYFYTLFLGMSADEYKPGSTQPTFLEVYDLDGNPVIRYSLKGKHPVCFAVDEETFTLYGPTAYDNPEKHLLIYKLKGLSCRKKESSFGMSEK